MLSVSERFKATRKELGFNQQQFARELGISQTHVSAIESGREKPSTVLLKLVCAKFLITEEWLIDGVGKPFRDWDMSTDDGIRAKYYQRRVYFEKALRETTGEDLVCLVESFCYLTGALKIRPGKLNHGQITEYRKIICSIIHDLEGLPIIMGSHVEEIKNEDLYKKL